VTRDNRVIDVPTGAKGNTTAPRALLAGVRGPVLARARLTGTYER